jgi:hypothetical protein
MRFKLLVATFLLVIGMIFLVGVPSAFAHEHRVITIANQQVEFVVGWVVEPPYVDEVNSIDFHATMVSSGAPVYGLDKALQVEVSTGGQQVTLSLSPVLTDDVPPQFFGGYMANIMPTVAGAYSFRFIGNVNGTAVNENFQCGPTTFECVEPSADIQFPEKTPSGRAFELNLQDMQSQVSQLQDALKFAYVVGASGVVVGLIGLVVGIIAFRRGKKVL